MVARRDAPFALRRRLRRATRVQLVGRSARVLATPGDGVGDITVTVARIAPGRMNAHRHALGGEAMYVPSGRGILWVEGLPVPLVAGTAAFAPEGALHNAENTAPADLIVVGMFCPGVVPGSYTEEPPRFAPTGALSSVAGLSRTVGLTGGLERGGVLRIEPLLDDAVLSPNIRMRRIRIRRRDRATRPASERVRAWVVLRGTGEVFSPYAAAGPLGRFDLVAVKAGTSATFVARGGPLTLLEFEASPEGVP
jgi:quercetin dioxygenase-like cupin family protein